VRRGPHLQGLHKYARHRLRLGSWLDEPGDGRLFPRIAARDLLWPLLASRVLREPAFLATGQMIRTAPRAFGLRTAFGDDALSYFMERLDAGRLQQVLLEVVQRARRNKAFARVPLPGLALDGTGMGRSRERRCELCHPQKNAQQEVTGHGHRMVGASVLAGELSLPPGAEFYPVGEGEVTAGKRLLERLLRRSRIRFDCLVVDGLYPGAPFLHLADELGLPVVARLNRNLPDLFTAAQARFGQQPPSATREEAGEMIEIRDADDFEPWEGLQWAAVRVIRYRQHRRNGEVVEAYWLTNFSQRRVGRLTLYRLCKSRWQIENRFFNEAKNLYRLEHVPHHHANAILIHTLLSCLAICIERLYRLRHLHRAGRPPCSAVRLLRILRGSLALVTPVPFPTRVLISQGACFTAGHLPGSAQLPPVP
jgi:hypothetical protein